MTFLNLIFQFNYLQVTFSEDDDKVKRRDILKLTVRCLSIYFISVTLL